MSLVIREATADDAQTLCEMFAEKADYEALPFNTSPEAIAAMIGRGNSITLIAEENDIAVGFANYNMADATFTAKSMMTVQDLYVHPDHRGCGFGTKILSHLANLAIQGDYGMILPPVADNAGPIKWYKDMGAETFYHAEILRIDNVCAFLEALER